jgi:hypothetical protein
MSKDQKINLAKIIAGASAVVAVLAFLLVLIGKVSAVETKQAVTATELSEYKITQNVISKQIIEKLDELISLHPRQ